MGDGEDRAALERAELGPNVVQRFIGAVPYADLPRHYAESDILLFPSLMDEWGFVVNEAMATGLPVLGSIYSQAVDELVRDGETGWVFDPLDRGSVAAALTRAIDAGPTVWAAMGETARQRIASLTPAMASARMDQALGLAAGDAVPPAGTRRPASSPA